MAVRVPHSNYLHPSNPEHSLEQAPCSSGSEAANVRLLCAEVAPSHVQQASFSILLSSTWRSIQVSLSPLHVGQVGGWRLLTYWECRGCLVQGAPHTYNTAPDLTFASLLAPGLWKGWLPPSLHCSPPQLSSLGREQESSGLGCQSLLPSRCSGSPALPSANTLNEVGRSGIPTPHPKGTLIVGEAEGRRGQNNHRRH